MAWIVLFLLEKDAGVVFLVQSLLEELLDELRLSPCISATIARELEVFYH